MASGEVIAKRYALAVAEHARNEGRLGEVEADLKRLAGILEGTADTGCASELTAFLLSPSLPLREKLTLASRVAERLGFGGIVSGFMEVMIRHGRFHLMPKVIRRYVEFAGEFAGELSAVVRTARPLSESQVRRLSEVLASAFAAPVRMQICVEPSLLAGVKLTVGDKTIDGTVLGRLNRLRHRLTAENLFGVVAGGESEDQTGKKAGDPAVGK
ncbi:MAG: ATP synthase F1 subunit delta [Planctomycetes bacterium]|nr:ATP synthase F1 subunit delta [Planctomycetota bacterium]